jgi:hypothetical protein
MSDFLARCSIIFSLYFFAIHTECSWHRHCDLQTSAEFVSFKRHLCNPQQACFRFNFANDRKTNTDSCWISVLEFIKKGWYGITAASRCKARILLERSNTGVASSDPTRYIRGFLSFFFPCCHGPTPPFYRPPRS